jgi:hydroxymethylpyrimidine/phosphomethylpyrimidine kinase
MMGEVWQVEKNAPKPRDSSFVHESLELGLNILRKLFKTLQRPIVKIEGVLEAVAILNVVRYEVSTLDFVVVIDPLLVVESGHNIDLGETVSNHI